MSDVAITCEGLGKQYRIGERERYKALRDVITDAATVPFRRIRNGLRWSGRVSADAKPTVWALRDASFEIKRGEVVGLIGRNGAGKSTLLKILSRITEPTSGYARIHGRIGSLLEVGTGFHPELTGRENIYLNGALLGMKKREIARKFDEIVSFAEVDNFIDTPVKRYSTGMYVRLAFAVAAHMETEILLVDEVLAVGDAQFQKKCLGKMGEVAKHGRTVLFVSHNMLVIQRLCSAGVLLDAGVVVDQGSVGTCVRRYSDQRDSGAPTLVVADNGSIAIRAVRVLNDRGQPTETWTYDSPLVVEIDTLVYRECPRLAVDITFYTSEGQRLFGLQSDRWMGKSAYEPGLHTVRFAIENPGLTVPQMYFDVGLRTAAMGYEALLTCAAYLLFKGQAPEYAHDLNLVTPFASVVWN